MADDFRDNLIIDRFDSVFSGMRASKSRHMRSQNSEDVVSWNVFRTFRQIDPSIWVNPLMSAAFGKASPASTGDTTVELWQSVKPPPALLQEGDEGPSEIDILIENPQWVLFIEAKLTSDISSRTTTRPQRDQVLRNIDVGSYYAGVRDFYFALLLKDAELSPKGIQALKEYDDKDILIKKLPHRVDGLANLRGTGVLTWHTLYAILNTVPSVTRSQFEADCAKRCSVWLEGRSLAGGSGEI